MVWGHGLGHGAECPLGRGGRPQSVMKAEAFRARAREPQPVTLADLLALHGSDSPTVLLLVVAVLCVLPVYGVGTALSGVIAALAWQWWRMGHRAHSPQAGLQLPERVGRLALDERWSRRCLHGLAWLYDTAGRRLRPRWTALSHARTGRGWSLWIGLMALLIFLPLPFGNVLPSLSLVLLSLGWMFRDGLALLASGVVGAGGVAFAVAFGDLVLRLLQSGWAWWSGLG